jgi:HEAT repeat protein
VLRYAVAVWLTATAVLVPTVGPAQPSRSLSALQRELREAAPDVRARAASELAAFDQRAVAALTRALNDNEYKVRVSAAEALVKIGPGPVVPAMVEALKSPDMPIRANAAVVLGVLGIQAQQAAVPALARALKDENARVRELAGEALDRIARGTTGAGAYPLDCH